LGCYDVTVDTDVETIEIEKNRTVDYGLFVPSFLRDLPQTSVELLANPISFEHINDYSRVDVEFKWNHPWPTENKYQLYDFLGSIIQNRFGKPVLNYLNLPYPELGSDIIVANADVYTEWFTYEFVSGWLLVNPGHKPNSKSQPNFIGSINPARYFAESLGVNENLWNYLSYDIRYDGRFLSGSSRNFELNIPIQANSEENLTNFGFVTMARWNDNINSHNMPCHREEAIACSVNVTDNIYYTGTESDGNLILDIGLWAWNEQPSVVMVESTVFSSIKTVTDPAIPGGDHYSIYHFDEPIDMPLNSTEGQEFWVIAESSA
jgi:hypothetical protein